MKPPRVCSPAAFVLLTQVHRLRKAIGISDMVNSNSAELHEHVLDLIPRMYGVLNQGRRVEPLSLSNTSVSWSREVLGDSKGIFL